MTDRTAYLFPGQGAQFVGMGASLVASSDRARDIFSRGAEVLGWDVLEVCLTGPEDVINSTRASQPAIFLLSMAVLDALSENKAKRSGSTEPFGRSLPAAAAAGLSLGEYSALVFAGCLRFEDALEVVGARGRFMQEACDENPGGMTSLLGLDVARVEELVDRASSAGEIGIANYNSPRQTVISGDTPALDLADEIAREMGCRRAVRLRVAGAYHSPLMRSATAKLASLLVGIDIAPPRCPFYSNITGGRVDDPELIRDGLVRQVESPVRWTSIVQNIVAAGADEALEIGPGNVLRGIAKSIDRRFRVTSICESATMDESCPAMAAST